MGTAHSCSQGNIVDSKTGTGAATADERAIRSLRLSTWIPWGQANIVAGTIVINVLALVLPLVILQTYDRIIPNQSKNSLALLFGGLAFALLLDSILRISRANLVASGGARIVHFLRCEAVSRLLNARIGDIERSEPGVHFERLSGLDALKDHNTSQLLIAIVELPFALIFLALILHIAWPLALVLLAVFAIFGGIGLTLGRRLKSVAETKSAGEDRRHSFVVEVLSGIHTVKALGMEALMNRRYERLLGRNVETMHDSLRLGARAQEVGALSSQLVIVAVAVVGAVMVIEGNLTIGGLAACTLLAGRCLQPLLKGLGFWTQVQNLRVVAERSAETFTLLPDEASRSKALPRLRGHVVAENITFVHERASSELFRALNLSVRVGETVAITGEDGEGKSTLLSLLGGILAPTSGRILYDGHDAAGYSELSIRRQVSYVSQHPVLFQGTILENLTGFSDGPAVDTALKIAGMLGIDEKIALLPDGFETRVGDDAADTLPAGMRQQISIIRAFAAKPAVVLFDEANASLDASDDARLREFLASLSGRTTLILASHRPSLIQIAHRRFRLAGGLLIAAEALPSNTSPVR
jgi:ATP-binding cassette, subfamily C, bacterial LapB